MLKKLMLALTLASAMGAANAAVLLTEDFNNVAALQADPDWVFRNESVNPGVVPGWGQGNPRVFPAHLGAPEAYVASSFQAATPGGILDDQLFTPEFSVENGAIASFYLRAEQFATFSDILTYGYTNGVADPSGFITQMTVIVPTNGWTRFEITLGAQGPGSTARLGFRHFGPEATSNYVGLDTLRITDLDGPGPQPVPEPATLMILGLGIAGLTLVRRRR